MIAAGSLFTSCVENTEPQGIRDLREAKADYLASLSKLREADAAVRNADAEYRKAETELKQAEAALVEAAVKAAEIAVELEDAAVQAKIAEIKAQAEIDAVKAQKKLAKAQAALEETLKDLAANSKELTQEEKNVIDRYTAAYSDYIKAVEKVNDAEVDLYDATYKEDTRTTVEVAKAEYEQEKADAELQKAIFEVELAVAEELSEAQIADYEEWVAKYDALIAENEGFKYDSAEIHKELALLKYESAEALAAFYKVVDEKKAAIAKARAGFSFPKYEKALPVVSFKSGSGVVNVVENFAAAADSISLVTIADKKIKVAASTDKDIVEDVVDSLNIIIDALNREKVVVDQIVKDTTGIAALVAKTNAEYKAVKDTLEAGIAEWKGIKDALTKAAEAAGKPAAARAKYTQDTAKLFAAIKTFVDTWNDITDGEKTILKSKDSASFFNAFKQIMVERKNVFGKDSYFKFFKAGEYGEAKEDSVAFSEIDYAGIRLTSDGNCKYAGTKGADGKVEWDSKYAFQRIVNEAFGFVVLPSANEDGKIEISPIKVSDIKGGSNYFAKLFFNNYWVNDLNVISGEIIDGLKSTDPKYADKYPALVQAKDDSLKAATAVNTAKDKYYEKFYCPFWGLEYADAYNTTEHKLKTDSLKINYTEKTYTDPYVLVTFSGKEGETVFTPAKDKKDASIDWKNVNYNDSSVALSAIKKQLGQNNIKIEREDVKEYTLYAKTLAVAQFASAAVNYKENTQALAELTTIVGEVETAFENAKAAVSAGSAKADSLQTALTGKKDGDIVNHNLTDFINPDGTFKLAGEQKTLAEKSLTDFAKTYAEIVKEGKTIDAKTKANLALAKIYADYIKELAGLQGLTQTDPDSVYQEIKEAWYGYDYYDKVDQKVKHEDGVLDKLQGNIDKWAKEIKKAEAKLAKLEAGYDQKQIDIEEAQNDLAEALAELEAAEAKLAAAEAAYKQVLANHGLAE